FAYAAMNLCRYEPMRAINLCREERVLPSSRRLYGACRARDALSTETKPHGGTMKSWITRTLILALLLVSFAGIALAQETHPSGNPAVAVTESHNAAPPHEARTEASLVLPDLDSVSFLGFAGGTLLKFGLIVCILGMLFGFM